MRVLFYGTGHLGFARRDSAMAQGTWPKPLAKAKRMLLREGEIPLPRFARSNSKKTLILSPPAAARCLSFWQNVLCRGLPLLRRKKAVRMFFKSVKRPAAKKAPIRRFSHQCTNLFFRKRGTRRLPCQRHSDRLSQKLAA